MLTARAAQLLDDGRGRGRRARRSAWARLYERAGMTSEALACFAQGG